MVLGLGRQSVYYVIRSYTSSWHRRDIRRRLEDTWARCLGFDHRIRAIGIALTACGVFSIFVLLLRFEWNVTHALHSSTERKQDSGATLMQHVFLAMLLYLLLTCLAGKAHKNK
jgi:hypothetical protein